MNQEAIDRLALRCLAHLQQEETLLRETLRIVEATRESLLVRDGELLEANVRQHQHTVEAADDLRARREVMRDDIAELLQISRGSATVSVLAKRATTGHQLMETRERLGKIARRVRTLHRANAVLSVQTNYMIAGALQNLLGEQLAETRYARTGRTQAIRGSQIIDTDI